MPADRGAPDRGPSDLGAVGREGLRLLATCNYPSDVRPSLQVFVRALLLELRALGADVTVIAPESIANLTKPVTGFRMAPRREDRDQLRIHRPRYVTLSKVPLPFGLHTSRWGTRSYVRAALGVAEQLGGPYDVTYGHFLYPHGLAAAVLGRKLGVPAVASLGESSFSRYDNVYEEREIGDLLARFTGVVANSELIKDRCVQKYGLAADKVRVFPNGVNRELFAPMDRRTARHRCGLPPDRAIIISVGQLVERKGPLRVMKAIESRPEIGAVFLGEGPQVPSGPQVLFSGVVPHEEVPIWLSAADLFVLPTLDEGCSNAILEAMSCGLPIVSSDLPFNDGLLDEAVSLLVDPLDPSQLSTAVFTLLDDPGRREEMKAAALTSARHFRLSDRAQRVLAFLRECADRGSVPR
ncbi:MAG: glycosyltransferase [Gemmatimonadetes bacterium]|nr:glycosyltransferase [Gemmatimonadota bacterium]